MSGKETCREKKSPQIKRNIKYFLQTGIQAYVLIAIVDQGHRMIQNENVFVYGQR